MLQDKDFLKDYSRLFQCNYRTKSDSNYFDYNSNQFLKSLQYFGQTQENLLKVPMALKGYGKSRKPSGCNGNSLGKSKNLYFNHHDNKAYFNGRDLYKSLEAYFNN